MLISLTGNVGRVSLCGIDGNCLLNQRVGIFVPYSTKLSEYIYQALSDSRFLIAMITAGQGAAQMNIGKSDIESFCIPMTDDLTTLQKISDCLYSLDLRIINAQSLLKALLSLDQFLKTNLLI